MKIGKAMLLLASFGIPIYLISVLGIVNWHFVFKFIEEYSLEVISVIVLMLAINSLGWVRWHILVRANDLKISRITSYTLAQYSGLFSFFLPGQFGADTAKILALNIGVVDRLEKFGERNIAPITGTAIDRLLALSSQIIWALIFMYFYFRPYAMDFFASFHAGILIIAFSGMVLATVVVVFLLVYLFKALNNLFMHRGLVAYFINLVKIILDFIRERVVLVLVLMTLSLALNALAILSMYLIARESITDLDMFSLALATILSNLASVVPITPGGLGISESIFSEISSALSSNPELINMGSIYMVYRFCSLGAFCLGTLLGVIVDRLFYRTSIR